MTAAPNASAKLMWRGLIAVLLIGVGVPLALYVPSQWSRWFGEWRRENPPLWAFLASSDKFNAYINTRDVVPLPDSRVAVKMKLKPKEKDRSNGDSADTVYVDVYGCDAKDFILGTDRFTTLSIFDVDEIDKVIKNPFHLDSGDHAIPSGSARELMREAACWLRPSAKATYRFPGALRPSGLVVAPTELDPWR